MEVLFTSKWRARRPKGLKQRRALQITILVLRAISVIKHIIKTIKNI